MGEPFAARVRATDPDGHALTYALLSAPPGMTIDAVTGAVSWVPATADVGNIQVVVQVSDAPGDVATGTFTLSVRSSVANRPPIITSVPPTDATVTSPFEVFTYKTGAGPTSATASDLGDGQISVITANAGDQQLGWLAGLDAAGTHALLGPSLPVSVGEPNPDVYSTPFVTAYTVPLGLQPQTLSNNERDVQGILAEDVNQDGKPDLIVLATLYPHGNPNTASESGHIVVRLGLGDGTFRDGWQMSLPTITNRSARGATMRLADVTSDGRSDLIVTMQHGSRTLVYTSTPDGAFATAPIESPNAAAHVTNMQMADINGDGQMDLVLYENVFNGLGREGVSTQLGDGTGRFMGDTLYAQTHVSQLGYVIDVDGVLGPDLVRTNYNSTRLEVRLNDGSGRFGEQIDSPTRSYYSTSNPSGTAINPTSAEFGDFDADGQVDAIVTGPQGIVMFKGRVGGLFGNGTASGNPVLVRDNFDTPRWPGTSQSDGHARDFNGDGRLDFVFGDTSQGSNVIVGLGDAAGGFEVTQYAISHADDIGNGSVKNARTTQLVGIADFNRDGVMDVVVGSQRSDPRPGSVGMLLGDKPGTLRAPNFVTDRSGTQGRLSRSVVGDFDNDGYEDVATFGGIGFGSALFLARGKGDGTFGPYTPAFGGMGYSPIALDIDLDGNLDLAWNEGTLLRQAFGLGNGAFQALPNVTVPGAGGSAIAEDNLRSDDFNQDGYPDLVYRLQTGNIDTNLNTRIVVLIYDPMTRRYNQLPDTSNLYSITPRAFGFYHDEALGLGDLNNDGRNEFFAFSRHDPHSGRASRLAIYEQHGQSGQPAADATHLFKANVIENPSFIPADSSIHSYVVHDFDKDGKNDLVGLGGLKHSEVLVAIPNGLADVVSGDVNGDGKVDVVAVNSGFDRVKLFIGSGAHELNRQFDVIVGSYPIAVQLLDIDDDDQLEILTANRSGKSLTILTHAGGTQFARSDIELEIRPTGMAIANVHDDDQADVVVISGPDRALQLLTAKEGTLRSVLTLPLGFEPGGVALGDVTGDGHTDILITDPVGGRVVVLAGNGAGGVLPTRSVLSGGAPTAIGVADMNNDGRLDLIVAMPEADQLGILFNRSAGRYTTPQLLQVGDKPVAIAVHDMNGDTKPDVLVTNQTDNTISVVINRFDPTNVYRYQPTAVDPDGDDVSFELTTVPGGMLYDESTGTILWAPMPEQLGNQTVVLTASDGNGGVAEQGFAITVTMPVASIAPVFTSTPVTAIKASEVYDYQPRVQSAENGPLKYTLIESPEGMRVDPTTGRLQWDARHSSLRLYDNFAAPTAAPTYQTVASASIPDSASLRPQSVTVEGWFKFQNPQSAVWEQLLSKTTSTNTTLTSWGLEYFYGTIRANVGKAGTMVNLATVAAPSAVEFDKWLHIAMTFDDTTRELSLFINGQLVGRTISPEAIGYSTNPVVINRNFAVIQNARVWDSAKSLAEIRRDMLAHIPKRTSGLVLDLRFEESRDANTLIDSSGYGHHAQMQAQYELSKFPQRLPGLAHAGDYPVVLQVEDGRGGIARQQFSISIELPFNKAMHGSVFDDANGDGLRNMRTDENLIVNGSFDSGTAGFFTDFILQPSRSAFGWLTNTQATVSTTSQAIPLTSSYGDHTAGVPAGELAGSVPGGMLIFNGDQSDRAVWRQTVPVTNGETYDLSFWALRPNSYEPAQLNTRINGLTVGNPFSVSDVAVGGWKRYQTTWTAASNLATVEIVSLGSSLAPNPGLSGVENGAAIDDIVFVPSTARKVVVPGRANPYLAGLPSGSTAFGSTAPLDSPPAIDVTAGEILRFAVTGSTTYQNGNQGQSPDGAGVGTSGLSTTSSLNGLSQLSTPNGGALLGVFLDDSSPAGQPSPPALDFRTHGNVSLGIHYETLTPQLRQLFVIGNGRANGTEQSIVVPAGATRLFLANGSGSTWRNEGGAFEVQVFSQPPGEPGQAGRQIFHDSNLNQRYDVGESVTATDSRGNYVLEVGGTQAQIGLVNIAGQVQTTPVLSYHPIDLRSTNGVYLDRDPIYPSQLAGFPTRVDFASKQVATDEPPIFVSLPSTSVTAPGRYEYQAFAQASDGQAISYELSAGPEGMVIDRVSGSLHWLPNLSQSGSVEVIVKATDSRHLFSLQRFSLNVKLNTAPIITSVPARQAVVGVKYQYDVRAQDAEQSELNIELVSAPVGMTLDRAKGRITWMPTSSGTVDVTLRIQDGQGFEALQSYQLTVVDSAPNRAPEFISGVSGSAVVGRTYATRLRTSDADHDAILYSLVSGPDGLDIDAEGIVSWIPEVPGDYAVTARASDGRGGTDEDTFNILVGSRFTSAKLRITSQPDVSAVVGRLFSYDVVAEHAAYFQLQRGPVGMSIDPQFGHVRWLPTLDQIGFHSVVIRASDVFGNSAEQEYSITVRGSALVPAIRTAPPTEVAVGETYLYAVGVSNPANNPLTFSLTIRPTGMSVDAVTGIIAWTPGADQVAPAPVIVRVADGVGNFASQSFTIEVSAGSNNRIPVASSTPPLDATVGLPLTYTMVAQDAEGQQLSYSVRRGPVGLVVGPASGVMTWTPAIGDIGSVPVVLVASDTVGGSAVQSFSIDVRAANRAPVIQSTPPARVSQGAHYVYDLIANDLDREPLFYTLLSGPSGMTIDALGRIRWQTQLDTPLGMRVATVGVSDGLGASVSQEISLAVVPDTQPPRLTIIVAGEPVLYPWTTAPARVRVIASDDVGVTNLHLKVDGQYVELAPDGTASVYFTGPGNGRLEAIASDAAGNRTNSSGRVNMRSGEEDGSGNPAPEAAITSLGDGAAVAGFVDIIGTAAALDFQSYSLSYRRLDSQVFDTILFSTNPVTNHVLGRWDTTLLENDSYVLKLEVLDTFGSFAAVEVEVSVTGNLKLGNFRVSFDDLVIPFAGIPIVITRTYDTLRAQRQGEFGYGWRLDYRDADLRTNLPRSGLEDLGIHTPFKIGTRVFVTIPGQERQGFTFTPDIRVLPGFDNNNLIIATPRFTPDRGVTNSLSIRAGSLIVNEYGDMFASAGIPWNPASSQFSTSYTLTTSEGIRYSIEGDTGHITQIADRKGNTIQLSAAGITSASADLSLAFQRDRLGRITSIVDPVGNAMRYEYSRAGDLISVTDRQGNITRYSYKSQPAHYLDQIIDPLGRTGSRMVYGSDGRVTRTVNGLGNQIDVSYDPDNSLVTTTDPLGQVSTIEYDARGNVLVRTDALGGVTRFTYNEADQVTSETNALGHVVRYTYDAFGNRISATNALGHTTMATFDRFGNPLSQINPLGASESVHYDDRGNALSITNPRGLTAAFSFVRGEVTGMSTGDISISVQSHAGLVTRLADPIGNDFTILYDALRQEIGVRSSDAEVQFSMTRDKNSRPLSVTDALGATSYFEYDGQGNRTAFIDPLGRRTSYQYDAAGRLLVQTFADGTTIENRYDAAGRMVGQKDQAGLETRYEYDALGRQIAVIYPDDTPGNDADNPRRRTEYNLIGNVIAEIDELGQRTGYAYDAAGRAVRRIDPAGAATNFTYDAVANVTSVTDPLGRVTRFEYNLSSDKTAEVYPDGSRTQYSYTQRGDRASVTDPTGHTQRYEYNALGQLMAVVEPSGQRTQYAYDAHGELNEITDPLGRVTEFEKDMHGRILSRTLPTGERETYVYDKAGNLISVRGLDGQTTTYEYDVLNRRTAEIHADGTSLRTTYSATGLPLTMTQGALIVRLGYDVRGRQIKRIDPEGQVVTSTYDAAGNRLGIESMAGLMRYSYDANHRVSSVTTATGEVIHYRYNAAGELIETLFPNGTSQVLTRNERGLITQSRSLGPAGELERFSYSYDASGRQVRVTELSGRRVDFAYDASGRLTSETTTQSGGQIHSLSYTYDVFGNRLSRTDSAAGQTRYVYDARDRLISETNGPLVITSTYDSLGNRLTRGTSAADRTENGWDSWGRLISVKLTQGDTAKTASYRYAPDGQRLTRSDENGTVHFVVDTAREFSETLAEYAEDGVVRVAYVVMPDDLGLIAQRQGAQILYAHLDANHSVQLMTDADGHVVDRLRYEAFGGATVRTGSSLVTNLYHGAPRDLLSGLDYFRARYYDSQAGRFASADTFVGHIDQPNTQNRYVFVSQDPVNRIDPSGNMTLTESQQVLVVNSILFASVGAGIGAAIAKEKGLSPIAGGILGGMLGGILGAGSAIVAGHAYIVGVSTAKVTVTTVVVGSPAFLYPLAGLNILSLFSLVTGTYGLLILGEAAGFIAAVKTISNQAGNKPGGNLPFSSLPPKPI